MNYSQPNAHMVPPPQSIFAFEVNQTVNAISSGCEIGPVCHLNIRKQMLVSLLLSEISGI